MPTVVPFETLTDLFVNLSTRYEGTGKTAFAAKPAPDKSYQPIYWEQVTDDVYALAAWLLDYGIEPGDRVALLSENRYEWAVVDLALQLIGGVNVSLYATMPARQCGYILQDSEAKLFFVSTGIQLKKALEVFEDCPSLTQVITFDPSRIEHYMDAPFVSLFKSMMAAGREMRREYIKTIETRSERVQPGDLATLVYTSGTTGKPKGVMLTHNNIVSNVKAALQCIYISDADRCLSFLPLCHCFERTAGYYAMLAGGAEIYYAESITTVAKNMREAHPTVIISVPRMFEKMYNKVKTSAEESAVKQAVFNWGMNVGRKYAEGRRGAVRAQKWLADKLLFNKLQERTGGRMRLFVSGGAALPAKIARFFQAAGLDIIEGYGLTETSPIMSAPRDKARPGTVGQVLQGVSVGIHRLEDDVLISRVSGEDYPTHESSGTGEILCKGPNVMKGYWNDEEATRKKIDDDGWLHTGDVGRFTDGYLQITDRIKHMIVNAGGKNIYPGPIEDLFVTSKWIEHFVVVGEKKPYMAALVVPDFDILEPWAVEKNIPYDSMRELISRDKVQKLYKKEIADYSKELGSHEKIRNFRLIPHEFTIEEGEITPTLKVKRRIVTTKYQNLIDEMFP